MTTFVCEKCGLIGADATQVVERQETWPVRGEDVTAKGQVRVCLACGEDIWDEDLESASQEAVFQIYRARHGIPSPADIRALRERYGLSQRSLSALLGLGEISIHRYENGSLPDEAHSQLLRFIQDPWNMQNLFERNGQRLPPSAQRKLAARLTEVMCEAMPDKVVELAAACHRNRPVDRKRKTEKRFASSLPIA